MTKNAQLKVRIPQQLRSAAHEKARQSGAQLSTIVRLYLEAYTASQTIK